MRDTPISRAMTHITEHIHADSDKVLGYKQLGEMLHYAPNHFHHIFTREMGMPPGAFIRNRRLDFAAKMLLHSRKTVLDICLASGFQSTQVFNRAFKKKFRLTPTDFRRWHQLQSLFPKGGKSMYQSMYQNPYPSLTDADRARCVPMIKRIYYLANLARRKGVLELEAEMENEPHYFLRKGILLIVDAVHPELVRDIMQLLLMASDYTGAELLERTLALEGILSIQAGDNPTLIDDKLCCGLGEKFITSGQYPYGKPTVKEATDYFTNAIKSEPNNPKYYAGRARIYADYADMEAADRDNKRAKELEDAAVSAFDEWVEATGMGILLRIIHQCEQKDLVIALSRCRKETLEKMYASMSQRTAAHIECEVKLCCPLKEKVVETAQQKLMALEKPLTTTPDTTEN